MTAKIEEDHNYYHRKKRQMTINSFYLYWAKYFAVLAALLGTSIGSAHGSPWKFAGLTEDRQHQYFYKKVSVKIGQLPRFIIASVTLTELDRGETLLAKRTLTLRANREASNYVPEYFEITLPKGIDAEIELGAIAADIKAQKTMAKTVSDQEIVVGFLNPLSYEKSEVEVDCERGVFRVVSSDSKIAMSRLNPVLQKTRKGWAHAIDVSPISWPQKAICSELKALGSN